MLFSPALVVATIACMATFPASLQRPVELPLMKQDAFTDSLEGASIILERRSPGLNSITINNDINAQHLKTKLGKHNKEDNWDGVSKWNGRIRAHLDPNPDFAHAQVRYYKNKNGKKGISKAQQISAWEALAEKKEKALELASSSTSS